MKEIVEEYSIIYIMYYINNTTFLSLMYGSHKN